MRFLATIAGVTVVAQFGIAPGRQAQQALRPARSIVDSVSVTEFGITEVDQLAIAAGRYLWLSGPRQGIAVIDLHSGVGTPVGRAGAGPGEYRVVSQVFGCEVAGGWVDDQLQRVTWLAPDGRGVPETRQLPSGILSRAGTRSAWCQGDSLWIAVERQGSPRAGTRVDSLDVLLFHRATLDVDTVATFQGAERRLRSKGALRTSLRRPYVSAPLLVRQGGRMIAVGRSTDSLWILGSSPLRGVRVTNARPAPLFAPSHQAVVRDSIVRWYEAEMEAMRYEPELRREFRTLIDELLREMELPEKLPLVRMASPGPPGRGDLLVVENEYPGSRQTCLSSLSLTGQLNRFLCRTWPDRTVGAVRASADGVWLAQWNDGGAWVLRIRR